MLRAQPHGLTPVVVLNGSPAWARQPGDAANPLAPPQERADLGTVAAAVTRRYGDQLRYYRCGISRTSRPIGAHAAVDPADYLGLLPRGCGADPLGRWRRGNRAGCFGAEHRGGRRQSQRHCLPRSALPRRAHGRGSMSQRRSRSASPRQPEAPASAGALNFGTRRCCGMSWCGTAMVPSACGRRHSAGTHCRQTGPGSRHRGVRSTK